MLVENVLHHLTRTAACGQKAVQVTLLDITERVRTAEKAAKAHELLIDAIGALPDGFVTAPYSGFPRVLNALTAYGNVFD